ncbi:radical SAM protein, partial [Candidatus Woesearchaeota archaeon]
MNYERFGHKLYSGEKLDAVAKKVVDWGVFNVCITGGEVLLKKQQLYSLLDIFNANNIGVSLNSNLTRLSNDDIKKLKDYNLAGILTSLNGPNKVVHDSFVGKDGAFYKTVSSIERVVSAGIPIGINFVGSKQSKNYIYDTGKLASQLGVNTFSCSPLIPNSSRLREHLLDALSDDELLDVLWDLYKVEQDLNLKTELQRPIPYCFFWEYEELRPLVKSFCGVGKNSVSVRANGDVTGCSALNEVYGNILTEDLFDVWKNVLDSQHHTSEACNVCDLEKICSGACKAENAAYAFFGLDNPLVKGPIKEKNGDNDIIINEGMELIVNY